MNDITEELQELRITNRNNLQLNGIKKVVSFDSKEFILETSKGPVHIYGDNLELGSLDTINGTIVINGKINGFDYLEKHKVKVQESVWAKLFKWMV